MNRITAQMLSRQYYHELSNSIKYQRLCNLFILAGLTGISSFLNKQGQDEFGHAQKVLSHIKDCMIPLESGTPDTEMEITGLDLLTIFTLVLEIEQQTTALLIELNAQAIVAGDILTSQWLYDSSGLLKEQIEEEATIKIIIERIKSRMINDSAIGGINYDIDVWIEQEFNA